MDIYSLHKADLSASARVARQAAMPDCDMSVPSPRQCAAISVSHEGISFDTVPWDSVMKASADSLLRYIIIDD
jgi:hypothetical protein